MLNSISILFYSSGFLHNTMEETNCYKSGRRGHATGHTLRRFTSDASLFYRGQFSIQKSVRLNDDENIPLGRIETINNLFRLFADCVDDGGLEISNSSPNSYRRGRLI